MIIFDDIRYQLGYIEVYLEIGQPNQKNSVRSVKIYYGKCPQILNSLLMSSNKFLVIRAGILIMTWQNSKQERLIWPRVQSQDSK